MPEFPPFAHYALTVSDIDRSVEWYERRDELESWPARLDELGIDHGDIVDAWYGSGLAFRDPDNIQLEFFHLAGA